MTNGTPLRPVSYDKKVGLVLQGGGALGSYQAGVYEAIASSEYLPDWVAGISIGGINAAIVAGTGMQPMHTGSQEPMNRFSEGRRSTCRNRKTALRRSPRKSD
jgi:predicted acylesterase/phospholipase RssA